MKNDDDRRRTRAASYPEDGSTAALIETPSSRFDVDTRLHALGGTTWRACVDASSRGYLGAHGGFLAALLVRAATLAAARPSRSLRSLSVQLLRPVRTGPVELSADRERDGASLTAVSVRASQGGRPSALALARFGARGAGLVIAGARIPQVPAPEDCPPLIRAPVPGATVAQYVEYRPAGGALPLSGVDRPEIVVWMRLADGRPADAPALVFLADAAVPAVYATLRSPLALPTVDLALHLAPFTDGPEPVWVLGRFRTRTAADGYILEDGELWAPDGRLLLHARQLRRTLVRPDAGAPTGSPTP